MKRHPALVPLSHDHQHTLAAALRLRRAAEYQMAGRSTASALAAAIASFLEFGRRELLPHLEDEERMLAPTLVGLGAELEQAAVRMLLEHARVRAVLRRLAAADVTAATDDAAACAQELAVLVTDHVRWEERELFEQTQAVAPDRLLADLGIPARTVPKWRRATLLALRDPGVVDGIAADVTATPIDLAPGQRRDTWTADRDVVLVLLRGDLKAEVDGVFGTCIAPAVLLVEAGASRALTAGSSGALLVSCHVVPAPLGIAAAVE